MSPVEEKYQALGGPGSWFGEPVHEERPTPDGIGRYRTYRQKTGWLCSIHWHPEFGACETHGVIRKKWEQLGFENSFYGYPTSDEKDAIQDDEIIGRMSFFQGGAIVWLHETDKWVLLKRTDDGRLLVYQRQRTTEQEAERVAGFVEVAFRIARAAFGL